MPTDWLALKQTLADLQRRHRCEIGLSVIAPNGDVWSRRGRVRFPSASTAKIPIMVQIYRMADRGELSLNTPHSLSGAEKANGSGVLRHLSDGLRPSLADLLYLMIAISDNTATNILIGIAGIDKINATMRELGMSGSILGRPMVGRLAVAGEQENLATPLDYTALMRAIVDGRAASRASCTAMLDTLALQQNGKRIGRYVPAGYRWGSKIGTNNGIVNDVGFIRSPRGTLLIAAFCRGVDDETDGEQCIAELTRCALRLTDEVL